MNFLKRMPAAAVLLFAAIVLYALTGSPTPDDPGPVEAALGCLLILSVASAGFGGIGDFSSGRSGFFKALQALFLCGLTLPTLSGVYNGNDPMLIARDLAAFAFLGLPLFLSDAFLKSPAAKTWLGYVLVFAGVCFALRTLLPVFNIWVPQGELLYLSNSPLCLFAGVLLAALGWERMIGRRCLAAAGCFALLAVILAAMLLDVQRATIGAAFFSLIVVMLASVIKTPKRALLPLLILAAGAILIYPLAGEALDAMAKKTAQVGLNMRVEEAQAVYRALLADPFGFYLGRGWGSTFASPAVGGLTVNYTHSFLTTLALKGGLLFLFSGIAVFIAGLYQIVMIFQRDRVRALALFWPLAIPVLFYASHKSLDFGLVLLLLAVWSDEARSLPAKARSCKSEPSPMTDNI